MTLIASRSKKAPMPNTLPVRRWQSMQWHIDTRRGAPWQAIWNRPQAQLANRGFIDRPPWCPTGKVARATDVGNESGVAVADRRGEQDLARLHHGLRALRGSPCRPSPGRGLLLARRPRPCASVGAAERASAAAAGDMTGAYDGDP